MDTFTLQDGTVVQAADFEFGFAISNGAKALVEETDDHIIIEGYASDFDIDRQDEAFEPSAFNQGLKAYLDDNPVILYHHKKDTAMGKALDARLDNNGLWVRAQVDKPEPGTPLMNYYKQVKNGVLRGFSVGGKLYRRMTQAGPKIFKCDLREISITPQPVNSRTLFAVAGKAFEDAKDPEPEVDTEALLERLNAISNQFDILEGKASQHPDGPKIAALLYHLQDVHTLAENVHQNAEDENSKNIAKNVASDVAKHTKAIHKHIANKVGPVPSRDSMAYYGGSNI